MPIERPADRFPWPSERVAFGPCLNARQGSGFLHNIAIVLSAFFLHGRGIACVGRDLGSGDVQAVIAGMDRVGRNTACPGSAHSRAPGAALALLRGYRPRDCLGGGRKLSRCGFALASGGMRRLVE